jgi:hypothetical protein
MEKLFFRRWPIKKHQGKADAYGKSSNSNARHRWFQLKTIQRILLPVLTLAFFNLK